MALILLHFVIVYDVKINVLCFSGAEVSDDGQYVLITVRNGCDPVNKLYYVDLEKLDCKIEGLLFK